MRSDSAECHGEMLNSFFQDSMTSNTKNIRRLEKKIELDLNKWRGKQ
jgi:hypothetical protein